MQACLSPTEIVLSGYKGGAKRRTATDKRTTYRKSPTKVRFRPVEANRAEHCRRPPEGMRRL